MLPDEHQHHTAEFILTAGLLPKFLLNYQGSIGETQNAGHPSEYTARLGEVPHTSAVPLAVNRRTRAATDVAGNPLP